MKTFKQTTLLFLAMVLTFAGFSQIRVKEEMNSIAGEMVNTLTVNIPEADIEVVLKEFTTLIESHKGEIEKDKEQYISENTVILGISNDSFTLYFSMVEINGGGSVKLITAFKLPFGFLGYHKSPPKCNKAKKILRDFAMSISMEAITTQLEAARKVNDNLDSAIAKLKIERDQSENTIVHNKMLILKAQADNKTAENTLTTNNEEVIVKAEAEIKAAENTLMTISEEQKNKEAELAVQQKVLEGIKTKLASIKKI